MGKVGDVHEPMLYACIAVDAASWARYVDSMLCFGCYVVMLMQRFVNLTATGGEGRWCCAGFPDRKHSKYVLNGQTITRSLCKSLILQFTRLQSYLHQNMFAQDGMVAAVWSVTYSCAISIRSHATHDQQAMCEVCSGSEGRRRRAGTVEGQAQWKGRHSGKEVRQKHHGNITSYFAVAQLAKSCTKQSLHIVNGMYQRPYSRATS